MFSVVSYDSKDQGCHGFEAVRHKLHDMVSWFNPKLVPGRPLRRFGRMIFEAQDSPHATQVTRGCDTLALSLLMHSINSIEFADREGLVALGAMTAKCFMSEMGCPSTGQASLQDPMGEGHCGGACGRSPFQAATIG